VERVSVRPLSINGHQQVLQDLIVVTVESKEDLLIVVKLVILRNEAANKSFRETLNKVSLSTEI